MKNLLHNPGFEGPLSAQKLPTGWYVPTEALPAQIDSTTTHTGKCSILIPGDKKGHALRQEIKALRTSAFIMGGYVRADGVFFGPGDYAYIYGHILYKGRPYGDATHFYCRIPAGTYSWHRVAVKGEVNTKYEVEKIWVTCTAKFAFGRMWFDDIFLAEASWRSELMKADEEAARLIRRLDEASALGAEVSTARAHATAVREIASKATMELPQTEGEKLVEQARQLFTQAYQTLTPSACAAIWGRTTESRPIEARILFCGLADTREKIDANLEIATSLHVNMLLPAIVEDYTALYPSQILPVRQGYHEPDLLTYMIEQAHRRNIAICPYIPCFNPIEKDKIAQSFYASRAEMLSVRHPKDPECELRFPDPANPQVRELIVNIGGEIVTRYAIDGIGLDYIRYPDHQAMCYCTTCRQAIRERFGFNPLDSNPIEDRGRWSLLCEWRIEHITATVKAVRDKLKGTKPEVLLYTSVINDPEYARLSFGQDWAEFAQYLDLVIPMNFGWMGREEELTRKQAAMLKDKTLFSPAIGGMPEQHEELSPDDWIAMVNLARTAGAQGIAIYALEYLRPEPRIALAFGPFRTPATIPSKQR